MARKIKRSLYFSDRKRYYRNKRARQNYALQKIRKQEEIIFEEEAVLKKARIRQQLVYNSDYAISIRAICINGSKTENQLRQAIEEFLDSNPNLRHLEFFVEGLEEEAIDETEDKHLNEGKIYIELNITGKITLTQWD